MRNSTKNGYLLTVTAKGQNVYDVRESLIQYIEDNIYISGMKYRSDIGKRIEDYGTNETMRSKKEKESQEKENKAKADARAKELLKKELYGTD